MLQNLAGINFALKAVYSGAKFVIQLGITSVGELVDHSKSQKHCERAKKKQAADGQGGLVPKRQATIADSLERATAASTFKETLVRDLVEAFMSANIPLEKRDNPRMRNFIELHVKRGSAIPQANKLRELCSEGVCKTASSNTSASELGRKF